MEQLDDQSLVVLEATVDQMLGALAIYDDLAGSEALTRALIAERMGRRDQARFWVAIFEKLDALNR